MHTLFIWCQHLLRKNLLLFGRAWRIVEVISSVKFISILLSYIVQLILSIIYFLKLDKVALFWGWRWSSGHTTTLTSTPLIGVNFNLQFLVKLFLRLVWVLRYQVRFGFSILVGWGACCVYNPRLRWLAGAIIDFVILHFSVTSSGVIIQRVNIFFIIIIIWIVLVDLNQSRVILLWCLSHASATNRGIPTMVIVLVLLWCVIKSVSLVWRVSMSALDSLNILLRTPIVL